MDNPQELVKCPVFLYVLELIKVLTFVINYTARPCCHHPFVNSTMS